MKTALLFAGLLLSFLMVAHVSPLEDAPEINQDGICVAEFNASFNFQNSVPWIEKLNDCTTTRVDIASAPNLQSAHKIVVVPTIVVFKNGEEVERFQANIMMSMEASKSDVQGAIDEIIMSDF
tara:strand:+ start:13 stop:381 length:369 start_codon:yes stop_codon:yes gene_type:complete